MTTIDEFEDLLATRKRSFSEVGQEVGAKPGLRIIEFDGEHIRQLLLEDLGTAFFNWVFDQLPKDATIMDLDGHLVRMKPSYAAGAHGTFYDVYCIVVASKEWEGPEKGGLIPVHQIDPTHTYRRPNND